jgi:hypothetical protein
MGTIERRTLEMERERWKCAIKVEQEAIAAGNLSLGDTSADELAFPASRRERLLELQSHLAAVESRLAAIELSVEPVGQT